jgi:DNA polymerase III delta prime subunit
MNSSFDSLELLNITSEKKREKALLSKEKIYFYVIHRLFRTMTTAKINKKKYKRLAKKLKKYYLYFKEKIILENPIFDYKKFFYEDSFKNFFMFKENYNNYLEILYSYGLNKNKYLDNLLDDN